MGRGKGVEREVGQWRKASAQRCLLRFLCPCPIAEEIWSSLVQAKQVSPPAHDSAALLALAAYWDFGP